MAEECGPAFEYVTMVVVSFTIFLLDIKFDFGGKETGKMPTLEDIRNVKQKDIQGQADAIRSEIKSLRAEIDFYFAGLDILQARCTHPTTRTRSAMGKETWKEYTVCGKEL